MVLPYIIEFKCGNKIITWFIEPYQLRNLSFLLGIFTGVSYLVIREYYKRKLLKKKLDKLSRGGDLIADLEPNLIYKSLNTEVNNLLRSWFNEKINRLVVDHRVFLIAKRVVRLKLINKRALMIPIVRVFGTTLLSIHTPQTVKVIVDLLPFVAGTSAVVGIFTLVSTATGLSFFASTIASIIILTSSYYASPLSTREIDSYLNRLPSVNIEKIGPSPGQYIDVKNLLNDKNTIDTGVYVRDEMTQEKYGIPGTFEFKTKFYDQKIVDTLCEAADDQVEDESGTINVNCLNNYKYVPLKDRTKTLSDLPTIFEDPDIGELLTDTQQEPSELSRYEAKAANFAAERQRINANRVSKSQKHVDTNLYTADYD